MNHSMIADEMAVFARVVELNGFTAAARKLQVPKVRVSRAVAALERALGARLLERTTRRISLTTAGRSILAHCQRVALEVEAARAALQPVAEGVQLRVAIDQGFGRLLVAPLVPRFLERFPQVTLRLINAEEVTDRSCLRRGAAQRRPPGRGRGLQLAGHATDDPLRRAELPGRQVDAAVAQRPGPARAAVGGDRARMACCAWPRMAVP